jgi:hypothetical protein
MQHCVGWARSRDLVDRRVILGGGMETGEGAAIWGNRGGNSHVEKQGWEQPRGETKEGTAKWINMGGNSPVERQRTEGTAKWIKKGVSSEVKRHGEHPSRDMEANSLLGELGMEQSRRETGERTAKPPPGGETWVGTAKWRERREQPSTKNSEENSQKRDKGGNSQVEQH